MPAPTTTKTQPTTPRGTSERTVPVDPASSQVGITSATRGANIVELDGHSSGAEGGRARALNCAGLQGKGLGDRSPGRALLIRHLDQKLLEHEKLLEHDFVEIAAHEDPHPPLGERRIR